jgi:hypothetical protein
MSEASPRKIRHPRPLNPSARQALQLWHAFHRLGDIFDNLASRPEIPSPPDNPIVDISPSWPFPPMPANQLAFQDWLRLAAIEIFGRDSLPDWPILSLDPPNVNGLVIYAARCGPFKFYAAWVAWSGTFIGWMRIQPAVEGIDSNYAIGEVLGRQLFIGISLDMSGHSAIDRFQQALKEVAWDLGAADDLTD